MESKRFLYHKARRDERVENDYHGTKISDPYVWLEDPDSEETKAFVEQQNAITMPYLAECETRENFKNRLTELWDYPKYRCPFKRGSKYFYFHNSGLQNQSVMYVQDTLDSVPEVFLDPNNLSEDGTIALVGRSFSDNGELFAFSLSHKGSDWVTIKFMKVCGKEQLPDVLENAKFTSMAWTHDNKGLFYNRYPTASKADGTVTDLNLNQRLYYHVLGTKQSEDVLCCEFPDHPKWSMGAEVSDCGKYLVLTPHEGCAPVNRLFYCDLEKYKDGLQDASGQLPYEKVVDNFDAEYEYITNEGTLFTFKTNLNAPLYKLINIDLLKPEMEHWTTLVEEDERDVLQWAACVKQNLLVLCYLHDVKNLLYLHNMSGERIMCFPLDIGSIVGFTGRKKDSEIFYQFTSFLSPGIIYHCDLTQENFKPKVFRETMVKGFDQSNYQTIQVFYPSKDGTQIPMFIVHKKDISLDGSHPVFLYGYGGFNISITPSFSVSRIVFMRYLGGIIAVPNLRGGGEYGEKWHQAGCFGNKQNVFDDFQHAAIYLIQQKYTSPEKIAICGGSNGGLLVGACINQRPELFGCAISQVP
ncbi:prolyl endopeptidase-like [Acropora millepora]|uniref:prolyl endopeptidase-like n=1 Tax=Acropora millepora TaxID=45264 RepID=UPI001CF450D8|nr:prolyl endopeptidase-like [Acropora millepora]